MKVHWISRICEGWLMWIQYFVLFLDLCPWRSYFILPSVSFPLFSSRLPTNPNFEMGGIFNVIGMNLWKIFFTSSLSPSVSIKVTSEGGALWCGAFHFVHWSSHTPNFHQYHAFRLQHFFLNDSRQVWKENTSCIQILPCWYKCTIN